METEFLLRKPSLNIISTPIGNLKDITFRAVEVLQLCDLVLAEDTRKSRILFEHYRIHTPLKSFRIHQIEKDIQFAIEELKKNKALGFITDAGTPGISDPVSDLIRAVRENFPEITILPVPGPSALTTLMSISGWKMNPTLYLGFLSPNKSKRRKQLEKYRDFEGCIAIFESVHRMESTIEDIFEIFSDRELLLAREMTKKFEEYVFIKSENFEEFKKKLVKKGEFSILISPKRE